MFIYFVKLGAENNPERSSISDKFYFYAKYDKNASTRAFFFNLSGSKITHSKSVVKCVAIIIIFIINNGTFLGRNLNKIIHQNAPIISIFLREHVPEPPSISVADIIISM